MAYRENGSGVDYYELRRRHEEYKKQRSPRTADAPVPQAAPARQAEYMDEQSRSWAPPVNEPAVEPVAEDTAFEEIIEDVSPAGQNAADEAVYEDVPEDVMTESKAEDVYTDEEAYDDEPLDDEYYDDETDEDDTNLFAPLLATVKKAAGKVRSLADKRRSGKEEEPVDETDADYAEPETEKEGFHPIRFLKKRFGAEEEEEPEFEDELPEEDFVEEEFAEEANPPFDGDEPPIEAEFEETPAFDQTLPEETVPAEDAPMEDVPIEAVPEEDVPEEEPALEAADYGGDDWQDEYADDEEEEDDYTDDESEGPSLAKRILNLFIVREPLEEETEDQPVEWMDMDSVQKPVSKLDDSLFVNYREPEVEEEQFMEENTNKTTSLTEQMAEGLDEQLLSRRQRRELKMQQMAAAGITEEDDNDTPEILSADEPTRRYEIVRPAENAAPARSLFDEDEDDVDEDEEEDDFDDDDFDDDEDDYKPSKKSKKSRKYDDEDDSYDDYGDDDYADDYDDGSPSAGHYVLGFFKILIAVILVLVIVLFGMYFADQAIDGGFKPYRWLDQKVSLLHKYLPASEQAETPAENTETVEELEAPEAAEGVELPVEEEPTAEPIGELSVG